MGPDMRQNLETIFGTGRVWSRDEFSAIVWTAGSYHVMWSDSETNTELQKLWRARKGRTADSLVLLAASDDLSKVLVIGPQEPQPVRKLDAELVIRLLKKGRGFDTREATAYLIREFMRLEESVVPGLRVKDLLTPHFVRERLRKPDNEPYLKETANDIRLTDDTTWRSLFSELGYRIEERVSRGYLLRHNNSPVAVVHPVPSPSYFGRLTENGELPEGLVLADCERDGAHWGILATGGRCRLFQHEPQTGAATGQYIEIDIGELGREDRLYIGLFAPESLRRGGRLTTWSKEAKDFGERLRKGLEERLITVALPCISRGLDEYLKREKTDGYKLRSIQKASLTLVFRFMFLLHVEARGYLPISSPSYYHRSALQLAKDSSVQPSSLDPKSTNRWDSLRWLMKIVRTGDKSIGVPAYNGGLFARGEFPGSELLERASIADTYLAPALEAIAYDADTSSQSVLDYAGLQIGHLGAIYEALLTMQLTKAPEDLIYDSKKKKKHYRPLRTGEKADVHKADLYYQTETGGRKAEGVFYTRHEFVKHLLKNSLIPALENHLDAVKKTASQNKVKAAQNLFDFSIVDPAIGSAHFLTVALDMMADRMELFLAETGLPDIKKQLDELRENGYQLLDDGDLLRRLILKRCIYGVDVSPMAVEIASVTLWLTSFVPGLALSYLGSNLKRGNTLIGVINPDVVRAVDGLFTGGQYVVNTMTSAAELQMRQASISDRSPAEVKRSEEMGAELRKMTDGLRLAFHVWTAEPLGLTDTRHMLGTYGQDIIENREGLDPETADTLNRAERLAKQHNIFHWPLEFPHIFNHANPGFDVVTGNPPWNEVTVEELGFYALRDPGLRGLKNLQKREERMAELDKQNPTYRAQFEEERERLSVVRGFFSRSEDYPLQGTGDTDLYKLFCERYTHLLRQGGHLGVVLPRSAFLAKGAFGFRKWLFEHTKLQRLDAVLNNKKWAFSDIHPQLTISLMVGRNIPPTKNHMFKVTGPARNIREFEAAHGSGTDIAVLSLGDQYIVPLVPSQKHLDVLAKIRRGVQFNILKSPNSEKKLKGSVLSHVHPHREIDETNQRDLFNHPKGEGRVPVWKGRCFDQYDPHGRNPAGYCIWSDLLEAVQKTRIRSPVFKNIFEPTILADSNTHPILGYRIAFRDVTNRTNSRTVLACLVPPLTPLTNKAPYLIFNDWSLIGQSYVLGVFNSIPFDWLTRRYVEMGMNFFILEQLYFPPWESTPWKRIGKLAARLSCVDDRFAKFATDMEVGCGPLDDGERNDMLAEIDASVAHAYGLTGDETLSLFTDFTENIIPQPYRELVMSKFSDDKGLRAS